MAERRMFAKNVIDSDAFLDMPVTARLLYYDLAMRADDDGFVNAPKKIMRIVGASQDDLSILIMRKFLIPFDSGVVVIKHWRIHNYIRKDAYRETQYKDEKAMLETDENNAYNLSVTNLLQERNKHVTNPLQDRDESVTNLSTQDRLGKDRLGKDSIETRKRFTPPTVEEVRAYCLERKNGVDPEKFVDFYSAKGWRIGKDPMKDWKAAVRTWEKRESPKNENATFDTSELDKFINNF